MQMTRILYWVLVFALVAFGSVAIFSIGAPFLLIGLTLAVLAPFRTQSRVFWPVLAGVVGFVAGYILVTPFSCTATARGSATIGGGSPGAIPQPAQTTCSSAIGITYRGGDSYNPPPWPGLLAGLFAGAGIAAATRLFIVRRERPTTPWSDEPPEPEHLDEGPSS
ncbi:MAG TPA: hypothetical protein VF660_07750 [Actinomycetota bacterium]|jgi:hypothetical protein